MWHCDSISCREVCCSKITNNRSDFSNKIDIAAAILFGKTRQAVLALLFEKSETEFYLREISRTTGIAPSAVQHELNQLHKADLVLRGEDGNRVIYRANVAHPIFAELQGIVLKTCGLPARIRSALAPLAADDGAIGAIEFAAIYGSIARGSAHARSDIDLLVVGDISLQELLARLHVVEQEAGREISVRLYSTGEFARRRQKSDSFLAGVLGGPLMPVAGQLVPMESPVHDA